jgi:hypothetical protein
VRPHADGGGCPSQDGLVLDSRAEVAVYQLLAEIRGECPVQKAIAVLPLPGAKLRDADVRTPDLIVLGNCRAMIIEVDGSHPYRPRKDGRSPPPGMCVRASR